MEHASLPTSQYDVYINFAKEDEYWVNTMLVPRLEKQGLHLLVGEKHFDIGVSERINIESCIHRSNQTILILSPSWTKSEWANHIAKLLTYSDPDGNIKRRLFPILLEDCVLPSSLRIRHKADCRHYIDWNEIINRLVYQLRRTANIEISEGEVDPNAPTKLDPNGPALQQDMSLQFHIGQVIDNRYTIISQLGKGGFAITYLADDTKLKKQCVIKQLMHNPKLNDKDTVLIFEMLEQEVNILVHITPSKHNIPIVYDFLKDQRCFVMNYINGQNLRQVLEQGGKKPISVDNCINYVYSVCNILEYLHSQNNPIIHCDIKLDNIILDYNGEIWLIDFGLGRALSKVAYISERMRASASGTPGYMPPEQIAGNPEPRSDIYTLGIVFFQLVTGGKYPFDQNGLLQQIKPHNTKVSDTIRAVQNILNDVLHQEAYNRPDARGLREQLELLRKQMLQAPDGTLLEDVPALVNWCEKNWMDESEEHSAVKWLYGMMPTDIEKVWQKTSAANRIVSLQEARAQFSHWRDHDSGLDYALSKIEPKGFGRAEPELSILDDIKILRFGPASEQTLHIKNVGRRYIIAKITRPGWLTTPTATVRLRPGEMQMVALTTHSPRLPRKRRVKDELVIHYGAAKPERIFLRVIAEIPWRYLLLRWALVISSIALLVVGIGWYWG